MDNLEYLEDLEDERTKSLIEERNREVKSRLGEGAERLYTLDFIKPSGNSQS
ncbi:hypothetical protein [Metallosphaera tengchongensis]|uniref:hypothetical protein n=1 Tax=Metallosphaera tengchongensis TaxID=1532350 RepID=UPI001FE4D2F0|nr:hypothetical protein [Metallosphaera tengchongensis]